MNFNCSMVDLIDHLNEPKDPLEIYELFEYFRTAIMAHLAKSPLNTQGIVRIIKDFREVINPDKDADIYFFTDRICDRILLTHEGVGSENISSLMDCIVDYEEQACLKH